MVETVALVQEDMTMMSIPVKEENKQSEVNSQQTAQAAEISPVSRFFDQLIDQYGRVAQETTPTT